MATIPDASDLGYRPASAQRSPRLVDQSGSILAESTGRLAGAVGQVFDNIREQDDRFRYAQAKSALLAAQVEIGKELEDDQDWESYESRYNEKMGKAREKASGMIRGPRSRALFDDEAKLDIERGAASVRERARRKEVDVSVAALNDTLNTNRNAALEAGDEPTRAAIFKATQEAVSAAQEKGYIDATTAGTTMRKWSTDYADAYVGMQSPEARVAMLSKPQGTPAQYIAPDRRSALLEAAKKENRDVTVRRESQRETEEIVAKLGTGPAALKAARRIADPEIQDAVVTRIRQREVEQEQAEDDYREAQFDKATEFVNGGGAFADLPLDIKNSLKPSELASLRAYAEKPPAARKTDAATLLMLSDMASDNPQAFGELSLMDYRDKLSDEHYSKFVDIRRGIRTGKPGAKEQGFMSIDQIRNDTVKSLFGVPGKKDSKQTRENRDRFITQFEARLREVSDEKGKGKATAADARKIVEDLTAEVATGWFSSKPVYKLDDDDIKGVPVEDRDEIIRELQLKGKEVSEDAILYWYRKVNGKPTPGHTPRNSTPAAPAPQEPYGGGR